MEEQRAGAGEGELRTELNVVSWERPMPSSGLTLTDDHVMTEMKNIEHQGKETSSLVGHYLRRHGCRKLSKLY